MPFKSIAALKKLTNLAAEVKDIAPLDDARIACVLTDDPVKLSVHRYGGSDRGKVTSVSLDNVRSVALIDKRVAVVKSGDDLWALLDIQHRPKVEQVGQHIRSLHAVHSGGSALAIGWDGNGAALKVQKNEVGGRQFVVRGSVRAASINANHTYVVVDGAGGGQLREHPGLTPESGATARGDLPADAGGFNLLAGGAQLSALSKRGASTVCVCRRQGNGYDANIMVVEGGVVDVAVIETSLFVLCADGVLRLYDSNALQGVAAGMVDATFEKDLRLDGTPTALTATTRGGNRLWIGSQGGDVVCCDAVKGEMKI